MPQQSDLTQLLQDALIEELDAIGEAYKDELGWPPLGQTLLTPGGERQALLRKSDQLAEHWASMSPEVAMTEAEQMGQALVNDLGPEMLQRAMRIALQRWSQALGTSGEETYMPMDGGQ